MAVSYHILSLDLKVDVVCRVCGAGMITLKEFLQSRAAGQSMPALDFRALALRLLQVSLLPDANDPNHCLRYHCCSHRYYQCQ